MNKSDCCYEMIFHDWCYRLIANKRPDKWYASNASESTRGVGCAWSTAKLRFHKRISHVLLAFIETTLSVSDIMIYKL